MGGDLTRVRARDTFITAGGSAAVVVADATGAHRGQAGTGSRRHRQAVAAAATAAASSGLVLCAT
eukprot:5122941-Prymnesium_polylepis.2